MSSPKWRFEHSFTRPIQFTLPQRVYFAVMRQYSGRMREAQLWEGIRAKTLMNKRQERDEPGFLRSRIGINLLRLQKSF